MTAMTVHQLLHPHKAVLRRRVHVVPAPAPPPEPLHPAERRMRGAGGPDDRACYSCSCGYVFLAPVSTTVQCPHCHTEQSW